jgi:glucan 1,3-beta-glucosidase
VIEAEKQFWSNMYFLLLLLGFTGAAIAHHPVNERAASTYWYQSIKHDGLGSSKTYVVYRNVKDYGAKGDAITDDSAAIQKAINTVDGSSTAIRSGAGLTGQPAVVYFPPGTYLLNSGLKNVMGTVMMGDPTSRPILKAGAGFKDNILLIGQQGVGGLDTFFHEIKNLILDSTAVPPAKSILLLQFSVSQACQLSNVMFNMPIGATAHIGVQTAGQVMPLLMNNLQFFGGAVGYSAVALQLQLKDWYFKSMLEKSRHLSSVHPGTTSAKKHGFVLVLTSD